MRVIIRFSLDHDGGSLLRNVLKPILEDRGIIWTGKNTGTYEGDVPEDEIEAALSHFWHEAATHSPGKIDHFWMYTDRSSP